MKAFDPVGMKQAGQILSDVEYCENAYVCAQDADAIVIVTEWEQFRATINSASAAESRQLSCSGSLIEPAGLAPSPKSLRLGLGPQDKLSIDLGQGGVNAPVQSNNRIQLKFSTKEFSGEFFHYTGDLFLIYKSGHLARLTCTPA